MKLENVGIAFFLLSMNPTSYLKMVGGTCTYTSTFEAQEIKCVYVEFCYPGQAVQRQYLLISEIKCTLSLPLHAEIMSVSWFFVEIGKNDLMDKHSRKLQAAQTDSLKNLGTRLFYF